MNRSRILWEVRLTAVAWLRLMLAVQLVVLAPALLAAPFGGLALAALATPPAMIRAAPVALFARVALRKDHPFVRPGYLVIAFYGALVLLVGRPAGMGEVGQIYAVLAYEVAAVAVAIAYVVLWRLADRVLGDAAKPRAARRWIFGVVLTVTCAAWVPFLAHFTSSDGCADRGGRMEGYWRCSDAPPSGASGS